MMTKRKNNRKNNRERQTTAHSRDLLDGAPHSLGALLEMCGGDHSAVVDVDSDVYAHMCWPR
jgi:hypothetical protein